MTGKHRQVAQDRVPQSRIQKTWNVSPWGTKDAVLLDLLTSILTSGKPSRLYKRLRYDEELVNSVSSFLDDRQISSQFYIQADAKPGIELAKVESVINEELKKILRDGVTPEELTRVKTQYFANFVKGMERIGGFGGKSDILAQSEVYVAPVIIIRQYINGSKKPLLQILKESQTNGLLMENMLWKYILILK
jgi:zinc protease